MNNHNNGTEELNPIKYPTLATYQPNQIWEAVAKLQKNHPDMTEQQCLLNLEMDLAQIDQMSRGSESDD